MEEKPNGKGPSDATRARRHAKAVLAPFVANLSSWHQQAARLMLEVERAEDRGEPAELPAEAVQQLIETVSREHAAFATETAAVTSSRVEDVKRSFSRLLSDLERTEERCIHLSGGSEPMQADATR
jgi:hypothetical protein